MKSNTLLKTSLIGLLFFAIIGTIYMCTGDDKKPIHYDFQAETYAQNGIPCVKYRELCSAPGTLNEITNNGDSLCYTLVDQFGNVSDPICVDNGIFEFDCELINDCPIITELFEYIDSTVINMITEHIALDMDTDSLNELNCIVSGINGPNGEFLTLLLRNADGVTNSNMTVQYGECLNIDTISGNGTKFAGYLMTLDFDCLRENANCAERDSTYFSTDTRGYIDTVFHVHYDPITCVSTTDAVPYAAATFQLFDGDNIIITYPNGVSDTLEIEHPPIRFDCDNSSIATNIVDENGIENTITTTYNMSVFLNGQSCNFSVLDTRSTVNVDSLGVFVSDYYSESLCCPTDTIFEVQNQFGIDTARVWRTYNCEDCSVIDDTISYRDIGTQYVLFSSLSDVTSASAQINLGLFDQLGASNLHRFRYGECFVVAGGPSVLEPNASFTIDLDFDCIGVNTVDTLYLSDGTPLLPNDTLPSFCCPSDTAIAIIESGKIVRDSFVFYACAPDCEVSSYVIERPISACASSETMISDNGQLVINNQNSAGNSSLHYDYYYILSRNGQVTTSDETPDCANLPQYQSYTNTNYTNYVAQNGDLVHHKIYDANDCHSAKLLDCEVFRIDKIKWLSPDGNPLDCPFVFPFYSADGTRIDTQAEADNWIMSERGMGFLFDANTCEYVRTVNPALPPSEDAQTVSLSEDCQDCCLARPILFYNLSNINASSVLLNGAVLTADASAIPNNSVVEMYGTGVAGFYIRFTLSWIGDGLINLSDDSSAALGGSIQFTSQIGVTDFFISIQEIRQDGFYENGCPGMAEVAFSVGDFDNIGGRIQVLKGCVLQNTDLDNIGGGIWESTAVDQQQSYSLFNATDGFYETNLKVSLAPGDYIGTRFFKRQGEYRCSREIGDTGIYEWFNIDNSIYNAIPNTCNDPSSTQTVIAKY